MMKYKIKVFDALQNIGITSASIKKTGLFSQGVTTKFKNGDTAISVASLEQLCKVLHLQPGDILEYVNEDADPAIDALKVTVSGKEVVVDQRLRRLITYDNRSHRITYEAPITRNGWVSGERVVYQIDGDVNDIGERLSALQSRMSRLYSVHVWDEPEKRDPDGKKWAALVDYAKNHPDRFFDEYGNLKTAYDFTGHDLWEIVPPNKEEEVIKSGVVTDTDGNDCLVDVGGRILISYCNREHKALYLAPCVSCNKRPGSSVYYYSNEDIMDIDERISARTNAFLRACYDMKDDPSWEGDDASEYIKAHPDLYFDEYGDWIDGPFMVTA